MTRRMEHELVRTLEAAAGRAPAPEPGLLDQLGQRRRVQRRRSQVVVSAAAVLAVVAGSAVTYGVMGQSGQSSTFTPAEQPAGGPAKKQQQGRVAAEPIEKVWPAAVHKVPNRLPDGRKFRPQTMVDDDTVLVSVDASFENTGELWLYDISDRTARKVTTVRTPEDATTFATNFTVGGGHVVWWIARPHEGKPAVELWGAPLTGGEPHLVGRVQGKGDVESLISIDGQTAHWSVSGGVYQAPLSGGEAELVAGTEKFALVDWPWVGTPVWPSQVESGAVVAEADPLDEITYRTLRNVETGEERVATERDGRWICQLRWCVGSTESGGAVQRRDGTGHRKIDGVMMVMGPTYQFARDRFVFASESIYDIETDRAGRVATRDDGGFRLMHDGRLYYAETKGGYQLVDMAAIEELDPPR